MSLKICKLIIFNLIINYAHCDTISVTTKSGVIIGESVITEGKELNQFLGVPFAEPPIKNLRFKKPVPVNPWKDPIKAVKYPNPCYQFDSPLYFNHNVSEDCLYLNIFAPKVNSDTKMPLLIWIHSGGFFVGTSTDKLTLPNIFSIRHNVIVVAMNYRLGTFGFLYSGLRDAPGNVGLYDQYLAIKWAKDNAEVFNGDPNKITIYGQSAGSMAVSIHILSPVSRNLFNNAVMMSGSSNIKFTSGEPMRSSRTWAMASKLVGCDNGGIFTPQVLECLRKLPPENLVLMPALNELKERSKILNLIPLIVYGNIFLPLKPLDMLKYGNYKKGVSLLEGDTNDEGSWFAIHFYDPTYFNSSSIITYDEAKNKMNLIVNDMQLNSHINPNDVSKLYFNGISSNDSDRLRRALTDAIGDFFFVCPSNLYSKLIFSGDKQKSRVFQYNFTQNVTRYYVFPQWTGAYHTLDIFYWFGGPLSSEWRDEFNCDDRKLSKSMMNVLAQFAYNGYPPEQNGKKWPKYYSRNSIFYREVIAPYYEFTSEPKSNNTFGSNLRKTECDFWKRYIERV